MASPTSLDMSSSPRLSDAGQDSTEQNHDEATPAANPMADDLSDNDSELSEVDEAAFEEFDPANITIDDRPAIAVDEETVKLLGRHKRKRDTAEGEDGETKKKRKEGKREKPKKSRKKRDEDDTFSGGEELEGKRARKKKAFPEDGAPRREKPRQRQPSPVNEEELDPAEKRRRALDKAMDAALKNPNKRRRRVEGIVRNIVRLHAPAN
jgi:transcription factor SPN1